MSASPPHWDTAEPDAWALASAREAIIRPLAEGLRIPRDAADAAVAALERAADPVALDSGPWRGVLHLQHAILACLRGQRPPQHWVGVCTARAFTRLIADLVEVVTRRDRHGGLVLADLLPNAVRWDQRPLRWRVAPDFTTAAPADRLVILGALATILQHRDGTLDDPFAVLWPVLSGKEQQALAKRAGRWPAHTRVRLHRIAGGRGGAGGAAQGPLVQCTI